MIKFGFVGVLCFFIDYGIMVFLTEVFGINYMVSSTVSFSVSVTVNYILSVAFVFETDKDKNKIEEIKTICWCGRKATMVARISEGKIVRTGDQIGLDKGEYISLCRKHYNDGTIYEPKN